MASITYGRAGGPSRQAAAGFGLAAIAVAAVAGCTSRRPVARHAAAAYAPGNPSPVRQQETFPSASAAAQALLAAVKARSHADLRRIFGPDIKRLVSGDRVQDRRNFQTFVRHALQRMRLRVHRGGSTATLLIGKRDWPYPMTLHKTAGGRWYFYTRGGVERILARRIGANELTAIAVCRTYVQAQREYAGAYHDGSHVLQFARRFISRPGRHDGLYWPVRPGQPQSPFGPLVAKAAMEGYHHHRRHTGPHPFHGYFFRILTRQGPAAPAGKYSYIINGYMLAGFGLVAAPARYGRSGIMTFMVNNQGQVYEKNRGPTPRRITAYNPGPGWRRVRMD